MTKQEALDKIKELESYVKSIDDVENDKLFLLSTEEYEAMKDSIKVLPYCWSWLRSPGDDQSSAAFVDRDGSVDFDGDYVYVADDCVRPAFKIKKGVDTVLPVYQGNVIQYDNIYDCIGMYEGYVYYLARYPYTAMRFGKDNNYETSEIREYLNKIANSEK